MDARVRLCVHTYIHTSACMYVSTPGLYFVCVLASWATYEM